MMRYSINTMQLSEAKKHMEPDGRWVMDGIKSHEEYIQTMVPKLELKFNVHGDVREVFDVIDCLLVYSYYNYEFYDIAYNKALQAMEMSFRLRFNELTGKMWGDRPLDGLIRYLYKRDHFDTDLNSILILKKLRNHEMHPEMHSFSGNIFYKRIFHVIQVINELYEDINLRQERKKLLNKMKQTFESTFSEVEFIKEKNIISLHFIQPFLVDNKVAEPIYYCLAVPTFSLEQYYLPPTEPVEVPKYFFINFTKQALNDSKIAGFDIYTQKNLVIQKITDKDRLDTFHCWRKEMQSIKRFPPIDHLWGGPAGGSCFDLLHSFTLR